VTTTTRTSRIGKFCIIAFISPASDALKYMPRGRRYRCPNAWHAAHTVGV